jgi:hypothetical protein
MLMYVWDVGFGVWGVRCYGFPASILQIFNIKSNACKRVLSSGVSVCVQYHDLLPVRAGTNDTCTDAIEVI